MRESNFAFPAQNKACVCITSQLYDRRALDTTAPLPLFNSLTHLTYLTSTSPRIREIMTMDGGLERLVKILQDFCFSPPPPENPTVIYGLLPPNARPPKPQPTLNPPVYDKHAAYRFSLAFQCVVNIGVRGSEQIRRRVVQAGTLDVVGCILEAWLVGRGFAVGPSSSATGMPRETREQRHARRIALQELRQREDALALTRALQRTQLEQMQLLQAQQAIQHHHHFQRHHHSSQRTTQVRDQQLIASQRDAREQSFVEEDDSMESASSETPSFAVSGSSASTSFATPRASTTTSASNSDTDLSTNNSTTTTPFGTGTPTGVVVIPTRDRSGTVIARPVWANTTAAPIPPQQQRTNNLTAEASMNGHARLVASPSPSPSRSTDTSRPDTETEDDGDGEDVDMDLPQAQPDQLPIAANSPERSTAPPPRTRLSHSRRAVGIVSENAPPTQTLNMAGLEGTHIIIPDNMGELGVAVNVGMEDGIVSLDQQATEDFAMGAPPGAPGAIEGTPRFGMGIGRLGQAPDVTPRAGVVGLPNEGNMGTNTQRHITMRSRAGTAPEPYTEPLGAVPGPSTSTTATRANSASTVANGHGTSANAMASTSTSAHLGGHAIPNNYAATTVNAPSPGVITTASTVSSTSSTATHAGSTAASSTPVYTGPYRDEDVLLGLQLLAYLSKYPHVRQAFYKPRPSFHPATLALRQEQAQIQAGLPPTPFSGKGKAPIIPPPPQKDGSYFKTFNGPSVMGPVTLPPPGMRSGKERALNTPSSSTSGSSSAGTSSSGLIQPRQTNVFSLVERFTFKPSSSELQANGGSVPRMPPEIQYWAGVVMRNACRKDDNRGGIRQCANMLCGKWEAYPREFAKCRRCRKAKYCGKECQSTAWSEGHRFWCSAKDVEDENGGHATGDQPQDGDEEDSGVRRRERRERDRGRGDDNTTDTGTIRGMRRGGDPTSTDLRRRRNVEGEGTTGEGRRRAETVTGASGGLNTMDQAGISQQSRQAPTSGSASTSPEDRAPSATTSVTMQPGEHDMVLG